jgi:CRP-like cAMP-binding protein
MNQRAPADDQGTGNRLLAALPREEYDAILPDLEPVVLELKDYLYSAEGIPLDHAWFPNRGVASIVYGVSAGPTIEVATVGPEGFVGVPLLLGSDRVAGSAFIQVPGEGLRMTAEAFGRATARHPEFNRLLHRYTLALMTQMAQNSACNRLHSVEERAARWLRMTYDRVQSETFPLTQEFMAQMLGVRRPTVSLAAGMLAKAGLIHYVRGQMTVLDPEGLRQAACECYGIITGEFERLTGAG